MRPRAAKAASAGSKASCSTAHLFSKPSLWTDAGLSLIWARLRTITPCNTNLLFLVALALRQPGLLKPARSGDWVRFPLNFARHPRNNLGGLRFRRDQAKLWAWLRQNTRPASLRTTPLLLDKHADHQVY